MYYRLKQEKSARVHFIPDLKVGVFVTLRAPNVITKRFGMILDDLLKFKNWVIENQCEQVAVESAEPTGFLFRRF